jgi:hypothetical protein
MSFSQGTMKGEEGDNLYLTARTTSSADPMNIVLVVIWAVIVDHEIQSLHIQSTSSHRSRDEQLHVSLFKVSNIAVPILLIDRTVKRQAGISFAE